MVRLIKQNPIWSFLIINYIISWSFLYPCYQIIKQNGEITPLALLGLIGAYGPSIAAIIIQSIISKKDLKPLLKTLIKVKVGFKIFLFVIAIPIGLYALAYFLAAIIFNGDLSVHVIQGISNIPFWFLAALPFGPLGEELGWRGFMLPKLMENHSVIKSTLLVGLAWGVWHLASFTFPGAAIPDFLPVSAWTIILYIINTIALSLVFSYVYLKSNGSVFLAILLHAFFNAASNIVFDFFNETDNFLILTSSYILNILLAAICGFLLIMRNQKISKKLN